MSIFDFFSKKETSDKVGIGFDDRKKEIGAAPEKRGPVAVYEPKGFGDVELVIDALKRGEQAVVKLDGLKVSTEVRVLDMLSGAVFALNGGITEIQKDVFFLSPSSVR